MASTSESLDEDNKEMYGMNNEDLTLKDTGNNILKTEEINNIEKQQDLITYDDKVFGNSINYKKPWKMGNNFTFLYFRSHPIIVIGPDCNILYLNP